MSQHMQNLLQVMVAPMLLETQEHRCKPKYNKDGVPPILKIFLQRNRRLEGYERDIDHLASLVAEDDARDLAISKAKKNMLFRYEVSPGTDLMAYLSERIKLDIENKKKSGDEKWTRLNVILSDADVSGEGEHKIVSFIREYGYQNNQCHAIYSPDSNCGLVALFTHEVNMFVYFQMKPKLKRRDGENTISLTKGVRDKFLPANYKDNFIRLLWSCCIHHLHFGAAVFGAVAFNFINTVPIGLFILF